VSRARAVVVNYCPNCGELLDDFGPCGCGLAAYADAPARKPKKKGPSWSMRTMVAKKLEREKKARDAKPLHQRALEARGSYKP
jgi:hypothetical protein